MKLRYNQENVKIYQGDARWMNLIEDGSVHLICTSPPYLNAREYSTWPTYQDYLTDMALVWQECYRVLCEGGRIAVNVVHGYGRPGNLKEGGDGYICLGDDTVRALKEAGFTLRGIIIWNKTYHVLGTAWGSWLSATNPSLQDQHEIIVVAHKGDEKRTGGESTIDKETFLRAVSSIWVIPPAQSWHPAPFPPEIPRRLIQLYTFKGDTVLDPFSGSGTTAFTAAREGRQGVGIELSEEYIEKSCGPMWLIKDEK